MEMEQVLELTEVAQWKEAWRVLSCLRTTLDEESFLNRRDSLQRDGYRLFRLHIQGELKCVAGVVVTPHVQRGRQLWIQDLVTLPSAQSKGYGRELIKFLEGLASDCGCTTLRAHTSSSRIRAQQFYEQNGFGRTACVFKKEIV